MHKLIIHLRSKVLVMLTHNLALPFLKIIRKPKPFPYNMDTLNQFEQGSLGRDLAGFLTWKDLKLLPYYAKHDIKHILLEYDTTDEGEVCLQCFMLGNGHLSFPVAATVLYGTFTMPEYWSKFKIAYKLGSQAAPIDKWEWFEILHEKTAALQSIINKSKSTIV
jgi:hypothetical protein